MKMFIVYDERANPVDGTDDASVLVSEHKERAAVQSEFMGYVWSYDVTSENELVHEAFVGPTQRLQRHLERRAVNS